ncbi:MAG: zinc ribbon domain-containing protein [Thermoplasmata archaeon]
MSSIRPDTPICQSCGMPMQKEEDFGTSLDGVRNEEYCQFCFRNGQFADPDLTMEQQIENLVDLAVSQMNMTDEQAREMAYDTLPNLKRWRRE